MIKYIAALLTVFNRKETTLRCLRELGNQVLPEGYEIEVFLTNDGCTDGTPEAIASEFPKVHVINGDGNLYWNQGMLAAWSEAERSRNYDYYLWLNDDTLLYDDAIGCLLQTAENTSNMSIVVGCTTNMQESGVVTYSGLNEKNEMITPNGQLQECHHFNGNCVLIPKYVYDRLGKTDPYFHHSGGDFDYGKRALKENIKNILTPKFIGRCDRHNKIPKWFNPQYSFKERLKDFNSPTGGAWKESFYTNRKHRGLLYACYRLAAYLTKLLFPSLVYKRALKDKFIFNGAEDK